MKIYQRKRRYHKPVVPIDIKRLYVRPGEILIVKVATKTTVDERAELMRWLGHVAPGTHVMITDQAVSLTTVQLPLEQTVLPAGGGWATGSELASPAAPGPLLHHPV